MSLGMVGWMALALILGNQPGMLQEERPRSMAQVAMLQALEGDWSVYLILVGGQRYLGGTSVAGMRFQGETMTFLDSDNRENEQPFIVNRIDSENERVDFARKQDATIQWYSLKLKGEEIWLFRDGMRSWKLPKSVTPNNSNVYLQLSRKMDE